MSSVLLATFCKLFSVLFATFCMPSTNLCPHPPNSSDILTLLLFQVALQPSVLHLRVLLASPHSSLFISYQLYPSRLSLLLSLFLSP
mmetsp:Transcript_16165/g.36963  ORF Transcript_16165/g.36963 Transcript_16165/m.36963 type:complete len:87 (+) Transcript_16165:2070-2330(+)